MDSVSIETQGLFSCIKTFTMNEEETSPGSSHVVAQDQGTVLHRIVLKHRPLFTQDCGVWRRFIENVKLLCLSFQKKTWLEIVYIKFIMGFMFMSCRSSRTGHHNMLRDVTFLSHAWGIRPITTHWISGQSQHSSLFRTISFVKIDTFQKKGIEEKQ